MIDKKSKKLLMENLTKQWKKLDTIDLSKLPILGIVTLSSVIGYLKGMTMGIETWEEIND